MSEYEQAKAFSVNKLAQLRDVLTPFLSKNAIIVTCGSYARREASNESDIDYYTITKASLPENEADRRKEFSWLPEVGNAIKGVVPIDPAVGGAFASLTQFDEMLLNVGGNRDSNESITRRMLFLLEGEALIGEESFADLRRKLLERYVPNWIQNKQITLFLLNDIIRYYRTMTVDYEYKTVEAGKPWAIRYVKLIFSRKLLYASGLFSVGATSGLARAKKIEKLEQLFSLPAVERIEEICGVKNTLELLDRYNHFLHKISDSKIRESLKKLKPNDRDNQVVREFKEEGRQFTTELMHLLDVKFNENHPIHRAILF